MKKSMRIIQRLVLLSLVPILRNARRLWWRPPSTSSRYLLLIAHPDDESMFFAPTLLNVRGSLEILCLSNGNFDGLGKRREEELKNVCDYLKSRMTILSYRDNGKWSASSIAADLLLAHSLRPFDYLLTFDRYGVSGHKNHISCYEGARLFLKVSRRVVGLSLSSKDLFRKYVLDLKPPTIGYSVSFRDYFKPVRMMLLHKSQLLWFRYLYILLSNFMSYNDYDLIEDQ
jgi:N-acetylglucosaminylphosphatidylinositol deacetylase